jgi:hypothetical protein
MTGRPAEAPPERHSFHSARGTCQRGQASRASLLSSAGSVTPSKTSSPSFWLRAAIRSQSYFKSRSGSWVWMTAQVASNASSTAAIFSPSHLRGDWVPVMAGAPIGTGGSVTTGTLSHRCLSLSVTGDAGSLAQTAGQESVIGERAPGPTPTRGYCGWLQPAK